MLREGFAHGVLQGIIQTFPSLPEPLISYCLAEWMDGFSLIRNT